MKGNSRPRRCGICGWAGEHWSLVETRPGTSSQIACPSCGCYCRERILWELLHEAQEGTGRRLRILELGGVERFGYYARQRFDYWNADITDAHAHVDIEVVDGCFSNAPTDFDVAICSFVLSEIVDSSERISLLAELERCAAERGVLLLFDDFEPANPEHMLLPGGAFFHPLRLGQPLIAELRTAGWRANIIAEITPSFRRLLSSRDLPALVAARDTRRVEEFARTTRVVECTPPPVRVHT